MEELLTTKQAAERLGVTTRRVRQLIEEKRLKAVKVGRDWAIPAAELARHAKRGSSETRGAA